MWWAWALVIVAAHLRAAAADPFSVSAAIRLEAGRDVLEVRVTVPPGHELYADELAVETLDGRALAPAVRPEPLRKADPFSGGERAVYDRDVVLRFALGSGAPTGLTVVVRYQGCSPEVCFLPQRVVLTALPTESAVESPRVVPDAGAVPEWRKVAARFRVVGRTSGYLAERDFLAFLDAAEGRQAVDTASAVGRWQAKWRRFGDEPLAFLRRFGWFWTLVLIVLGGVALNLTPCVLPMIPVTLGILGAGVQGQSRWRGMALGGAYGLGMAVAYGALGLVVVLTGSQFGAWHGSSWFQLVMGVLFMVLALGAAGVITIDLTRLQNRLPRLGAGGDSGILMAVAWGAVSAVLAGACVAPVVLAVLALTAALFAQGQRVAVLLPFGLGVGMGLPWPLLAAGLGLLPRPGKWMVAVKVVFAVLVGAFGVHFLVLSYRGFTARAVRHQPEAGWALAWNDRPERWASVLAEAHSAGRPVLVDFWAQWCKNCHAMEATTFRAAAVQQRLANYTVVKFQAERPNAPETKEFLGFFEVRGLPTYLVLKAVTEQVR